MSIQIPEHVMGTVVAKAILDGIDQAARDEIIQQAIVKLVETPKDPRATIHGRPPPSPLKAAFDQAVEAELTKVVREAVGDSAEVQAALRGLISPLIDDLTKGNWDGLPEALSSALAAWFRDRER